MKRKSKFNRLFLAMSFAWILALPGIRAGGAESSAEHSRAFDYRRIFVPIDSPAQWPIGKEHYLPISQSEFKRLIQEKSEPSTSNEATTVRLAGGTYNAELVDGQVLVGNAELIVLNSSERPRLLSLSPLNLAVTSATWNRDDSVQAEIGIWQGNDEVHGLGVFVSQSDTLRLQWQLRARASSSSSMDFLLKTPIAVPQVLALVLPKNHTAALNSGELFRTEDLADGKTRYWFQLAPIDSHSLKVLRKSQTSTQKLLPQVARSTSYRLEPEGLSFLTSFQFGAVGAYSGDFVIDISSGAKIVSVEVNQQAVSWRLDDNSDGTRLVVNHSLSRLPLSMEIRCIAQMQFDQTWQLPVLRPREVSWTEGTARLVVSPKLELQSMNPRLASLQHIKGLSQQQSAAAEEEVFQVQEWSEDASVEVFIGRRRSQLQVRTATTIDIDPQDTESGTQISNESTARTVAEFSCQGRPSFQIEASVSPNWSIEAVKSDPSSALEEWHIVEDEGKKLLRIQLNEPILPGSPFRLEIDSSVQQAGPLLPARTKELSPLRFLTGRPVRRLLLLRSRQRGQMELLYGLDHSRLAAELIDESDATLMPDLGDGVLLDLEHLDEQALVKLQSRSDRYHAEVNVDVRVLPNTLEHHYRLDCSPISGVVSEILVQFDLPLPDTAKWKLVGHRGGVVATLIDQSSDEETDLPDASDAATTPVTYRLQLPVVVEGPFSLQTQYSTPATETQPCNLLSLSEASDWRGQVVISGPLDGVEIDDRLWTPLAQPEIPTDQQHQLPVIGCYRLGAHQTRHTAQSRSLIVSRTATKPENVNLFAWVADYQSFHAADGTTIFVATYFLENSGSTGADIQLPPQAALQEAWLDQEQFEPREVLADQGKCRFHFDNNRRYPTLKIKYVLHGPALQHATTLVPPLPECSFQVNLGRWTPWMPEQYVIGTSPNATDNQLTWTTRLFGPLLRASGQMIFNPFRVNSWRKLWPTPLEKQWPMQRTVRLSESIASLIREGNRQQWGQLLHSASAETITKHLLLVDREALREQGIQAATWPLGAGVSENHSSDSQKIAVDESSPLASRALAFVVGPHSILLTTEKRIAQWSDLLQRTNKHGIFKVSSEHLKAVLENLTHRGPLFSVTDATVTTDLISVDAWIASPTFIDPPWHTNSTTLFSDVGHRVATIEFVDMPLPIVIYRESAQRAQWHVIWLLTFILSTWLIPRHANKLVLLSGFLVAACLVASPEWLLGSQAILLGLLSALVLQIPLKKISWNVSDQPSTQLTTRAAALVVLLAVVLICSQANAEQKDTLSGEAKIPAQNHLRRVLIPVDSTGKPQGEDVYLPESFLKELKNTPEESVHGGARCVLVSALYRGELPSGAHRTTAAEEVWSIALESQCFGSNSELDLPFRRDEAQWLEDAHRLDGFPVSLTWNQDGNGCRVNLGAKGTHRLELFFKPVVTVNSNQAHLKLHVPRLPNSRMDFSVPANVSKLKINSAGKLHIDQVTRRWQAPLSVTDELQMNWTTAQNSQPPDSIGKVEQLAWLHVSPSTVRLNVQIRINHPAQAPEELLLAVSPELRLLPQNESSPIERSEPVQENPSLLRLKLKPNLEAKTILPLLFEVQRKSSLGRVFYPQIRIQGATTTRSLFAVSVSQGLSYEETLADDAQSIAAAQFASRWGVANESPLFAYSQTNEFPRGSLRIWPSPKSMSVQQIMRVHCELQHVHIEYEADVDEIVGNWLTHRLWIPAQLTIEDISVSRRPEMDPVAVRWSRVHKSQVSLFLEQPLKGPHVISVRGHIDVSKAGEFTLPAISLVDNERSDIHVDLTRESDVLVNWVDPNKISSSEDSKNMVRGRKNIPVGRWTWRASGPKNMATFRIEKNEQQFATDTLTTISQDSNGWTATLHSAIHVQKGVLSQVTLAVPNGFRPPYRLEPAGLGFEGDVQETVSGRQITFLLSKPIAARKTFAMHVTGELDLPPNQRLEVPHLRLIGSTRSSRYLLLPKRAGEHLVEWNWIGLKSSALPKSLSRFADAPENSRSFLIEKPKFFAQERSYQGPLQKADLRYAFISGTLDQAGNLSATAELVLQPGRATHCSLRLPEGAQLKQLVVGDSRVRRESISDRDWRIPLGPPFLPRKIKAVYQVLSPMTLQTVRLTPPEVLIGDQPLPLPLTYWQIRPVGSLQLGSPLVGIPLQAEQFARSAHQLPLETLNDSRMLAMELPISEGRSWFRSWQRDTQLSWEKWRTHELSDDSVQELSPTPLGSSPLDEGQASVWPTLTSKLGDSYSKRRNKRSDLLTLQHFISDHLLCLSDLLLQVLRPIS